MKKFLLTLCVVIVLVACSTQSSPTAKMIECDECLKTKEGDTYIMKVYGVKTTENICNDCYEVVKKLVEGLDGTIEKAE